MGAKESTLEVALLVADESASRRATLRDVFGDSEFRIVGEAETGPSAVELGQRLRPDLVLLGIRIPCDNVLVTVQRLKQLLPLSSIIACGSFEIGAVMKSVHSAGGIGFVVNGSPKENVLQVARHAIASRCNGVMCSEFYLANEAGCWRSDHQKVAVQC